ncbi:MAG: FAD-dependent oxidoreductase [Victivallaceae bacterium]|nr:FAD-dependent oxidoreductase [Victivallaceae bacterium]
MKDNHQKQNIIVVGGGIAGIAAALSAAKTGVSVLLINNEGNVGGDACTGMPILGAYSTRGEKCVGGVLDELLAVCKGFSEACIGPVCDFRTVYGLCVNPEALRLAILLLLKKYGVKLLLNAVVTDTESVNGTVTGIKVICGNGETRFFNCRYVIDATGSGNIVSRTGGKVSYGDVDRNMQPVSLVFRMANVAFEPFLRFIKENPEEALLAENPVLERSRVKAAELLYRNGYPYVALSANGKLLGTALLNKTMYPCTAMFITPVSMTNGELCINSTRLAHLDASLPENASGALLSLAEQVQTAIKFLTSQVPGFEKAVLSGIAPRLGIRETGRILGEYELKQDDIVSDRKFPDGIGLGTHHVDIHGAGTEQTRIPVKDGGAYGIPFSCLIPRYLNNVLVAGRCIASDRGANGSARVMGTCLVTGQAAGTAATLADKLRIVDFRKIDIAMLKGVLLEQGAILA